MAKAQPAIQQRPSRVFTEPAWRLEPACGRCMVRLMMRVQPSTVHCTDITMVACEHASAHVHIWHAPAHLGSTAGSSRNA
eukprot:363203-Chlamydomonas_euryale.AAC.40